jgi:CheY-like chemotaxis protein
MKKKLLIVEDDTAIRLTLAEIMDFEGYEVIQSANGQEALDHLYSGYLPNLILLDLMMPIKDGFAFRGEQMKNPIWSKIPVVIISANGNIQTQLEKMGGNLPSLRKPPDLDLLIRTVQENCS